MLEPEPDQKFGSLIPAWHHVDCFLDNVDDLDAVGVAADELSGFTKLKKDDKDELLSKLKPKAASKKKRWVLSANFFYSHNLQVISTSKTLTLKSVHVHLVPGSKMYTIIHW